MCPSDTWHCVIPSFLLLYLPFPIQNRQGKGRKHFITCSQGAVMPCGREDSLCQSLQDFGVTVIWIIYLILDVSLSCLLNEIKLLEYIKHLASMLQLVLSMTVHLHFCQFYYSKPLIWSHHPSSQSLVLELRNIWWFPTAFGLKSKLLGVSCEAPCDLALSYLSRLRLPFLLALDLLSCRTHCWISGFRKFVSFLYLKLPHHPSSRALSRLPCPLQSSPAQIPLYLLRLAPPNSLSCFLPNWK